MLYYLVHTQRGLSEIRCVFLFHPFSDRFQVSANLLLETEEVRQNISKLNKEV